MTYDSIITHVFQSEGVIFDPDKFSCREPKYVQARSFCFIFGKKFLNNPTLKELGSPFKKDHATVMHGISKLRDLMSTEPELLQRYETYRDHFKIQYNAEMYRGGDRRYRPTCRRFMKHKSNKSVIRQSAIYTRIKSKQL